MKNNNKIIILILIIMFIAVINIISIFKSMSTIIEQEKQIQKLKYEIVLDKIEIDNLKQILGE